MIPNRISKIITDMNLWLHKIEKSITNDSFIQLAIDTRTKIENTSQDIMNKFIEVITGTIKLKESRTTGFWIKKTHELKDVLE